MLLLLSSIADSTADTWRNETVSTLIHCIKYERFNYLPGVDILGFCTVIYAMIVLET